MTTPTFHKLLSGGYLVDIGQAFPVWRRDMEAVRRFLLDRDLEQVARRAADAPAEVEAAA